MFSRLSILLLMTACSILAQSPTKPAVSSCSARSDLVGKCFMVHGRLSVYNGTPSIRLWPIAPGSFSGAFDPKIFPTSRGHPLIQHPSSANLIGTNSSSATFWFARSLVHNQEECKRSVYSLASTYWFAGANEPGEWKVAAI